VIQILNEYLEGKALIYERGSLSKPDVIETRISRSGNGSFSSSLSTAYQKQTKNIVNPLVRPTVSHPPRRGSEGDLLSFVGSHRARGSSLDNEKGIKSQNENNGKRIYLRSCTTADPSTVSARKHL